MLTLFYKEAHAKAQRRKEILSLRLALVFLCAFAPLREISSQESRPADFKLQTTIVDTYPKEYLLALRADTNDRLFVGARETLYVYEPKKDDGYHPRKRLYTFPRGSWINDIEVRGDHVYVLMQGELYVFIDGARKRADLLPRLLVWGLPHWVKITGFKSLAWGPEGDLYFSVGGLNLEERWSYWTFFGQPEGTKLPYRGVGGVFRCKPDGTELRVVAHGLRNPGALVFDHAWNLFTCDHSEKTYQYWHVTTRARLGRGVGPADGLAPMFDEKGPPIQAGPFYFDEPALPKQLRHRLRWANGNSLDFAIKPRGASFTVDDAVHTFHPPRGFSVAGGGRVFALHDQHKIVMLTNADDPKAHAYEPYESSEATPERLWRELSNASWIQRSRAHVEIARRGGELLKDANKKLLTTKANDPAFTHLIWLAAKSGQGSLHLLALVDHADPRVRVQAIRALTEFPDQLRGEPIFTKRLLDEDSQVLHSAMSAYFEPKVAWDRAIQAEIERGPACSKDPYLRQTAALLLAQKLTRVQIEGLCERVGPAKRLAGVLTAGFRLTLPPATEPLAQQLPLSHVGADYRVEHAEGKRNLRDHGRIGGFTIAEHWKADKHTVEQELLFKLLRKLLADEEATVRAQAAAFLAVLDDARCKEEVERVLKK